MRSARGAQPPLRGGRVGHSRRPLDEFDRALRSGISVASVARTVADLAHDLDDEATYRLVREAQFHKLVQLRALELANRRRPSRNLTAVIEDLQPTDTPLEDLFVRAVVRRYHLPQPLCQQKLEGFRVDFHWPAARLIVETDGRQHDDPLRRQADRIRDNVLGLAGQLVLRYTKADLKRRHRRVADQILDALVARESWRIHWMQNLPLAPPRVDRGGCH